MVMSNKLVVKNGWGEVTLREFLDMFRLGNDDKLEGLNMRKRLMMISMISNYTMDELMDIDSKNLATIIDKTSFLDREPPKRPRGKTFKIDNVEYIFHPNYNNLTAGEMLSVEQVIKDSAENGENSTPGVLAILIRPTVEETNLDTGKTTKGIQKFNAETFFERKEMFMDKLTVDKFYHELAFFLTKESRKGVHTLLSTELKEIREGKSKKK